MTNEELAREIGERQVKVINVINAIYLALAGLDEAEAKTALTLAVVGAIISTSQSREEMLEQSNSFADQVRFCVGRDDIVEWMKAGITYHKMAH